MLLSAAKGWRIALRKLLKKATMAKLGGRRGMRRVHMLRSAA